MAASLHQVGETRVLAETRPQQQGQLGKREISLTQKRIEATSGVPFRLKGVQAL